MGANLLGTARQAFTRALETVAALSVVVVMVAAVAVVAMLRDIGTSAERRTDAEPHSIEILSDPKYTGNMPPLV